ncbi:MAG: TA system VapC family ribonuclease toxin [Pseudomonadota bacterium]
MSEDVPGAIGRYRQKPSRPLLAREAPGLPWPLRPGSARGDLPDINVWLALALKEHVHHEAALRYWAEVQASDAAAPGHEPALWFCRATMLGLVRLMCQPKVVGAGAMALHDAFALYRSYLALPGVGLLPEPPTSDVELEALVAARAIPPRMWSDAWLASQARASGLRLVTFDKDFLRFNLERCIVLPVQ